ncbi:MAG: thioredoxin family protein [Holophagales bacterium]|jgi:hypothetical protein|nr:thioredoxin family protein [Holophagales bacterium]
MLSALIIAIFNSGYTIETHPAAPTWPLGQAAVYFGDSSENGLFLRDDDPPVLIGPTTAKAILEHRSGFQKVYDETQIPPELSERWQRINKPCSLVVAFGSWCGDSRRWVPEIIKLAEADNPYISIYWVGTGKNKKAEKGWWPPKAKRQKIKKVPTVWLFAAAPKGKVKKIGKIVENPPKAGQTMAEAVVELLESVR